MTSTDLWTPPGADVPDKGVRAVRAAVEGAPPVLQKAITGAAVAELKYREKKLRRAAARVARKSRKANRRKR